MVATASTQRYFRKAGPDGEENTNEWHAYRDDGNTSLCGEAQMTYNVDSIADAVPASGTLHLGCREALAVEEQDKAEAENAAAQQARAEADGLTAPAETDGDGTTETQTVTGDDVADLNATLGEGHVDPDSMNKSDLQDAAREADVSASGTKSEIADRINEAADAEAAEGEATPPATEPDPAP